MTQLEERLDEGWLELTADQQESPLDTTPFRCELERIYGYKNKDITREADDAIIQRIAERVGTLAVQTADAGATERTVGWVKLWEARLLGATDQDIAQQFQTSEVSVRARLGKLKNHIKARTPTLPELAVQVGMTDVSSVDVRQTLNKPVAERVVPYVRSETGNWRGRAACLGADPELFYTKSVVAAKRICAACDVRLECLEEAIEVEDYHGVQGGMTEKERRALVRTNKRRQNSTV